MYKIKMYTHTNNRFTYYIKSVWWGINHLDMLAEENDAAKTNIELVRDWQKMKTEVRSNTSKHI